MRRLLANAMLVGLGLALPLCALGQTTMPVIAPVASVPHAKTHKPSPVWQQGNQSLSVFAGNKAGNTVPSGGLLSLDGRSRSTGAGLHFNAASGVIAHAKVQETRWAPLASACHWGVPSTLAQPACPDFSTDGLQQGEIGAGFAGNGVKLDLSVGQSRSEVTSPRTLRRQMALPRVLPTQGGADVAAPLWFRNSTATDIRARGQVSVAPDTRFSLGASVGRVHFLPGSGVTGDNSLDQATLSLGVQHGAVRGTIVGHVLEPNLPGAALDRNQRWSGIDLGISVRLPWRGELNFGAQNVWTSGNAPLMFGPAGAGLVQGRVPYVQYHQDIF